MSRIEVHINASSGCNDYQLNLPNGQFEEVCCESLEQWFMYKERVALRNANKETEKRQDALNDELRKKFGDAGFYQEYMGDGNQARYREAEMLPRELRMAIVFSDKEVEGATKHTYKGDFCEAVEAVLVKLLCTKKEQEEADSDYASPCSVLQGKTYWWWIEYLCDDEECVSFEDQEKY